MQFYVHKPKEKEKLNAAQVRIIPLLGCSNLFVDLHQGEELLSTEKMITAVELVLVQLPAHIV